MAAALSLSGLKSSGRSHIFSSLFTAAAVSTAPGREKWNMRTTAALQQRRIEVCDQDVRFRRYVRSRDHVLLRAEVLHERVDGAFKKAVDEFLQRSAP